MLQKRMFPLPKDKFTLILAALCIVTAASAWYFEPPKSLDAKAPAGIIGDPDPADGRTAQAQPQPPATAPAIENYIEILSRPLFNAARRAPDGAEVSQPVTGPAAGPAPKTRNDFKLVGIMIVDDKRFALVKTPGGRTTRRVEAGGMLDDWRVTSLTPYSATLNRGSESETIKLERKGDPRLAAKAIALANKRRARAKAGAKATAPPPFPGPHNAPDSDKNGEQARTNNEDEDETEDE